jgi:predicted porin
MKKSLLVLAILASVASAQAQVTLYGVADVWVGRTANTDSSGVKTDDTLMSSGGLSGSRLGVSGEKALGNGLKGVFKLEQGFKLDTGKTNESTAFSRQAYVGMAGGFGQVTLGKTWTAMDDVLGAANSGFDSALSASNNVLMVPSIYQSNPGNTVKYTSPAFGPVSFSASHSMHESNGDQPNVTDFSVSFSQGALATNLAYQEQRETGVDVVKLTALNAAYDFGAVKLLASVGQLKAAFSQSTDLQFGVDVPVNKALTVSAGYAQSNDNAAAGNGKRTGFGIAAGYSLADTTTLYGGLRQAELKDSSVKDNLVAVGIKHAF